MNLELNEIFYEAENDSEEIEVLDYQQPEIQNIDQQGISDEVKEKIQNLMNNEYKHYSELERDMISNALNVANNKEKMKDFCEKMNDKVDKALKCERYQTFQGMELLDSNLISCRRSFLNSQHKKKMNLGGEIKILKRCQNEKCAKTPQENCQFLHLSKNEISVFLNSHFLPEGTQFKELPSDTIPPAQFHIKQSQYQNEMVFQESDAFNNEQKIKQKIIDFIHQTQIIFDEEIEDHSIMQDLCDSDKFYTDLFKYYQIQDIIKKEDIIQDSLKEAIAKISEKIREKE